MVVAQLVERSPEVRGSNPVTGNLVYPTLGIVLKRRKKKKSLGMVHLKNVAMLVRHGLAAQR